MQSTPSDELFICNSRFHLLNGICGQTKPEPSVTGARRRDLPRTWFRCCAVSGRGRSKPQEADPAGLRVETQISCSGQTGTGGGAIAVS